MKILKKKATKSQLHSWAQSRFGDMIKGVVDIEKNILALDADLHADLEALLLDKGSKQQNLWGINLYPELEDDEILEYDSMINIRPSQNNYTRSVEDPAIQKKIDAVVKKWIDYDA